MKPKSIALETTSRVFARLIPSQKSRSKKRQDYFQRGLRQVGSRNALLNSTFRFFESFSAARDYFLTSYPNKTGERVEIGFAPTSQRDIFDFERFIAASIFPSVTGVRSVSIKMFVNAVNTFNFGPLGRLMGAGLRHKAKLEISVIDVGVDELPFDPNLVESLPFFDNGNGGFCMFFKRVYRTTYLAP